MKKVKFISAQNCEKNEQFGDKWMLSLDAGKGPFDAWYQGKKDLAPLVGTEAEVIIENKAFFGNPNLKFKIKFPGGKGFGGKAYNPTPEQQMRAKALACAVAVTTDTDHIKDLRDEFYTWIKG